ncbi:fibronectin type-III domain-containing protein [Caerostris extrusa]|uniref:Fibronectin type-III domain-containing protein n=1 Tax=Caerostris extrusa TaxID=172846 RepID=A0AAV4RHX1_CAEEX|nr:fibronectin type-III domain-containing protein [Caerostris extrusa]
MRYMKEIHLWYIRGYVLLYKSESGDISEESHVAPQRNSAVIKNLKCGTKYHFFLTAFNNAGRGRTERGSHSED